MCSVPMERDKRVLSDPGKAGCEKPTKLCVQECLGRVWIKTGDKKPSLVGEEQLSVDFSAFLLLLTIFQRNFPGLLFLTKTNPFRIYLYQKLFINFGHCSVQFAAMR